MIESLRNIRAATERFPDMPADQVMHLCYICTLICNEATWHEVMDREHITYSELRRLLTAFNADELEELQTQAKKNNRAFLERLTQDVKESKWHKAHPRISVWPEYDPDALVGETQIVVIQVNGKKRGTVEMPTDSSELLVEDAALQNNRIKTHLEGKRIRRKVFVMGRILNFVVDHAIE